MTASGRRRLLGAADGVHGGGGRALRWQADQLDGFRRGWERGACAHEASRTWRPPVAFVNATRSDGRGGGDGDSEETRAWMALEDLGAWRAYAWPLQEVDLIAWSGASVGGAVDSHSL